MSQYYSVPRKPAWNYGGKQWKLSRSKIELFLTCPRCFYLDNKFGVKRPPGYPFNLNTAVDVLLKKEFDIHRAKNKAHPLMKAYGIDAVPFYHEKLDEWRNVPSQGINILHKPTGLTVMGGPDDIWVDPKGNLIVVDYKATSKDEEVSLSADWQIGYKRQMEVYQWLLRELGFKVSRTGYFVYCNGRKDKEAFDGVLEFNVSVLPYTGNTKWVEPALLEIKKTLQSKRIPKSGLGCDYCLYRDAVQEVIGD